MSELTNNIENIDAYKYVVVGAGLLGSVLAQNLAAVNDERVLVLEKRPHIGGNCYSEIDPQTGIEFHKYGSHIFHTSSQKVWDYINRFSSFTDYRHHVFAKVNDKVYPLPVNLETINSFFNVSLSPEQVADFIKTKTIRFVHEPANFEEQALAVIGPELYEAFFKGYSIKQWQTEPKDLPAAIFKRLPFRTNYESGYFNDTWQGIPTDGYTAIFEKLLAHENIDVHCNTDFFDVRDRIHPDAHIIYSGPIDRFFDHAHGKLQWRTLEFSNEILDSSNFQTVPVMNYPEINIPYTRIHEPKHLHPERNYATDKTLIIKEFSKADEGSNPYYPLLTKENTERLGLYREMAAQMKNITVAGRLGDYKYYDMDQTIERALQLFEEKFS